MPGSIKIDDGSGNYTILTSPTSLGADKTITMTNDGIKEVDQWTLTAAVTSDAVVSSNLSRLSTSS